MALLFKLGRTEPTAGQLFSAVAKTSQRSKLSLTKKPSSFDTQGRGVAALACASVRSRLSQAGGGGHRDSRLLGRQHGALPSGLVRRRAVSSLVDADGVVRSPFPDMELLEQPLPMYVMQDWTKFGDRTALVDGVTDKHVTYAQLLDQVTKTASGLARLGLDKNDVITLFLPNCLEFPVFYLATGMNGAIVSPVNPVYTAGELEHAVNLTKSRYIVTVPGLVETTKDAMANCPTVKEIVVVGEAEGCRPSSWFLEDDGKAFPSDVTIDVKNDLMALPFSSGTTGMPKGVMLSHFNIVTNVEQTRSEYVFPYSPDDVMIGILPMFHIYGQVVALLGGLRAGCKIVVLPKFDAQLYLSVVAKYKATFLHLVPPLVLFLAKHPMVKQADFSSVRSMFTGAAPVGSELMAEALQQTRPDIVFRQGYGLTEASPVTHVSPPDNNPLKFHTIGTALQNTEFKVVDIESGKALGEGEEGELLVRGPQIMQGYLKNPTATAETIRDGWLHTGDIGRYDEDGHMIITDRLKELIKHKGLQVAPAELEALLLTHPAVVDVAVIGKPDDRAGELPRAYVVTKPGQEVSEEELQDFVKGKVAPYKELSGGVEFRQEIPKASSGKILRRILREELKEELEK